MDQLNLDKTNIKDQLGHMQVKSAELKTHLSHYLRHVQETGEDIEVCVRDTPVAYLTRLNRTQEAPMNTTPRPDTRQLAAAFQTVGLTLSSPVTPLPAERPLPRPTLAGDGRADVSTVTETRSQRDW